MLGLNDEYSRFEIAMEAADMAWWEMELPSGVVFFHKNKATMIGRKADEFTHYTDFTNIVHPDDQDAAMNAMKEHLEGKAKLYETVYRIRCKDGTYKKFYDRGKIVSRDKETIRLTGFVIHVTDAKIKT